jgi:hypothetical protein
MVGLVKEKMTARFDDQSVQCPDHATAQSFFDCTQQHCLGHDAKVEFSELPFFSRIDHDNVSRRPFCRGGTVPVIEIGGPFQTGKNRFIVGVL